MCKGTGLPLFPLADYSILGWICQEVFSDYQPEFFPFLVELQTTLNNCTPCLVYISLSVGIFCHVIILSAIPWLIDEPGYTFFLAVNNFI